MVFGASDDLIFAQQRMSYCQTHDGADVSRQLPCRLHPKIKTGPKTRVRFLGDQNKVLNHLFLRVFLCISKLPVTVNISLEELKNIEHSCTQREKAAAL